MAFEPLAFSTNSLPYGLVLGVLLRSPKDYYETPSESKVAVEEQAMNEINKNKQRIYNTLTPIERC